MNNKKAQTDISGYSTIIVWVVIILIAILLLVLSGKAIDLSKWAWGGIKRVFPFI